MKTHSRWVLQKRQAFGRGLGISLLFLLLASALYAAPQDVDLAGPCPNPNYTIEATVGAFNLDINALNAANGVSWIFDAAPNCAGVVGNPAPTSYDCANGVTVTLPGAPGSPVTVTGPSTAAESFQFALEADDGTNTCVRTYEVILSEPFDIVLVLDRSGSMGSSTHILPPATSRWDALKRAVNGFTPIVESSSCAADSNFGLTLFSTNVVANNSFNPGLEAIGGTLNTDVSTELNSQAAGGMTAMGSGLQDGIGKLADNTRKRVVMLFSDGQQNQDPMVDHTTGTSYVGGGGGIIAPGGTGSFRIVTIGIGNPMGTYQAALQNLATAHGGTYHVTQTGEDISAALDTATQSLLAGCSPQMVASYSGNLVGQVSLAAFDVNSKASQLLIKVSYSRDFEPPNFAQLLGGLRIEQDGNDVTQFFQPVIVGNFTNTVLLKTGFSPDSGFSPQGSYTIRMSAPAGIERLDYRVVVFADDKRLAMDWQVNPTAPRVNQPFEPTMSLSWLSAPLTDASVEAVILKPGDDLGDLLAKDPLTVDPTSTEDAGSPGYQKYLQLLEDGDFLAQLLPGEQQLTLTHQGGGAYSAAYDPGDVSGVYQVLYRVSAEDLATFGKVQRLAMQSVWVRFGEVDMDASAASTTVDDNTITINLRLMTTTGRFIGPAQGGAISVDGAGVSLDSITDHQDGSYTLVLTGDPNAEISVKLLDDEIYQGAASDVGAAPGGGLIDQLEDWLESLGLPGWLVWVLLLLILLLIIWLVWRLIKGSSP